MGPGSISESAKEESVTLGILHNTCFSVTKGVETTSKEYVTDVELSEEIPGGLPPPT